MTNIGFTGTQKGMTDKQFDMLFPFVEELCNDITEFHHGDCIGADEQAHEIFWTFGVITVCHPPSDPKKRAFTKNNRTMKPLPYMTRNKNIVKESGLLIATPAQKHEIIRSGTWATIRMAWKLNIPALVIFPDGTIGKYYKS